MIEGSGGKRFGRDEQGSPVMGYGHHAAYPRNTKYYRAHEGHGGQGYSRSGQSRGNAMDDPIHYRGQSARMEDPGEFPTDRHNRDMRHVDPRFRFVQLNLYVYEHENCLLLN